jgi:inner membrane protein
MAWWAWVLAGVFLLAVELLAVGNFYIFFFGIGAILMGFLALAGIAGPVWLQWLLFPFFSVMTLVMLRRRLVLATAIPLSRPDRDDFIGMTAIAAEEIPSDGSGRVEMRGTQWSARNVGIAPLQRGDRCVVLEMNGLTLGVRKED